LIDVRECFTFFTPHFLFFVVQLPKTGFHSPFTISDSVITITHSLPSLQQAFSFLLSHLRQNGLFYYRPYAHQPTIEYILLDGKQCLYKNDSIIIYRQKSKRNVIPSAMLTLSRWILQRKMWSIINFIIFGVFFQIIYLQKKFKKCGFCKNNTPFICAKKVGYSV
jgi:hypothetical protein